MAGKSVSIKCPKLKQTEERLLMVGQQAARAVERGLRSWGEKVGMAAKLRVPVDTGTLMNSIFVTSATRGAKASVEIGAGGPAAPYAQAVHENLNAKVHWRRPGSGPKYIENPVREAMDGLDDEVSRELDALLKRIMK